MALKDAVRKIYLYLFSIVGLTLLIIGCVSFLNMGLKAYVFTMADEEVRINSERLPEKPYFIDKDRVVEDGDIELKLTASQKEQLGYFFQDLEDWQLRKDTLDTVVARRHRDAARNLALILIGLPLYIYHWSLIKKETKA